MSSAQADYKPKSILITGGAGFIGSAVVRHICKKYDAYKIVVLDKLDYCASLANLEEVKGSANFKFIKGDITSVDLVNYILTSEEIDTIMHFAAQTHVDNSFGNSFAFTHNNVVGTHVLLEAAKVHMPTLRRFIHVSTDEVYGENKEDGGEGPSGFSEQTAILDPTNPYSATKASAEMLVKAYSQSYGLPTIVTRGNNVFGPHQYPEKLIPKFLTLCMHARSLPIHGDGQQFRSYLYVDDVARAFDIILHKGTAGQIYNIGTKHERSVLSVAEDILKLFDRDPQAYLEHVPDRLFNDRRYFVDDAKLLALGWRQLISWEAGLKLTFQWYKDHPDYWPDVGNALLPHPLTNSVMPTDRPSGEHGEAMCKPSTTLSAAAPSAAPSAAAAATSSKDDFRILIFGRTGWIGGLLGGMCEERGIPFEYASARLEDRRAVERDILQSKCTHVLNAAGVTGRPNVDWCEEHRRETIRANVIGTLTLADVCSMVGVHLTNFATGCIFEYDTDHPMDSGIGFTEEERANFSASYYSKTKGMVEELLRAYEHVLTLRVRMPISEDLEHPRNFIYKISRYTHVVNVPNSMTVLPEMLPMAIEMARRNLKGIYNFTNPGVISHNEILDMYAKYHKPGFTYKNFSLEDQAKILAAGRSNNMLDTTKLQAEFPELLPIRESLLKHVFSVQKKGTGAKMDQGKRDKCAVPVVNFE